MSREIISRIEFKGLPAIYSSANITQAINLEERLVNEGFYSEISNITNDYFLSIDNPLVWQQHLVQSTIYPKKSFTIYHIENSYVELLSFGTELKIYTKDGRSFKCKVLDKSRETVQDTLFYKSKFTVKEIVTNDSAINNYLIKTSLLKIYNNAYSDSSLHRICIDNTNIPNYTDLTQNSVALTHNGLTTTFSLTRTLSNYFILKDDVIPFLSDIEFTATVTSVTDTLINFTTLGFSILDPKPTEIDVIYATPKRLIFYTALAPRTSYGELSQSTIENDYVTRVAVSNVKEKLHFRFYLTETERQQMMFYFHSTNAENIKYFAPNSQVAVIPFENISSVQMPEKEDLIGIYECNIYLPTINKTTLNLYNV